ncbi:MAG: chromosomal replication initiator protein DnaA, partial [Candidatus Portnoybacteria bacterium CG10_big_fil_rev_8_21_14_0_10_44_7]
MDKIQLWQSALGEIELNVSRANFITWFKNTAIKKIKDGAAVISTPNGFSKEWLENKYNKLILKALRNVSPEIKEVDFIIGQIPEAETMADEPKTKRGKQPAPAQAGFAELEADKETNLNSKYIFENFVVGAFNELAQAAAQAVIKNPGRVYNPLFIYGGVGLGKTHLLQATGNEALKKN